MHQQERKSIKPQMDSRTRAVIPMTIYMAYQYSKGQVKMIDDQPFENIEIVGRLIDHSISASKHYFTINDDTGIIRVQLITQVGKKPAYLDNLQIQPLNKYVSCIATPKLSGTDHDQLIFLCNRITQIQDKNYVTAHLTEIIRNHLSRKFGFPHN